MKDQLHFWIVRTISILNKKRVIIQLSPPSSGSTLVFNLLRELFPERIVKKVHRLPPNPLLWPIVVTYRHPFDCIASNIQKNDQEPTDEVITQQIYKYDKTCIWDIPRIKEYRHVLLLRYEGFVYDYDYIFERFEKFFKMKISSIKRSELVNHYKISAVEKITEQYRTFSEFDQETKLHGKHISKYKGQPYYYKEFFSQKQIEQLTHKYKKFLDEFGYPPDL
jgi:hypothetical protein